LGEAGRERKKDWVEEIGVRVDISKKKNTKEKTKRKSGGISINFTVGKRKKILMT